MSVTVCWDCWHDGVTAGCPESKKESEHEAAEALKAQSARVVHQGATVAKNRQ